MVEFFILRDGLLRQDLQLLPSASPKITMDSEKDIKMQLSGVFKVISDVNFIKDRIICTLDGQKCGEFIVTKCETFYNKNSAFWKIDACDQAFLLRRFCTEERLFVPAGSSYLEVIQNLMKKCGIFKIISDDSFEIFLNDREWDLGCDFLSIINQLLKEISFNSLWFDSDGNARLTRYSPPSSSSISHIFSSKNSLIENQSSLSLDISKIYNVFMAISNSFDNSVVFKATASNDDANSDVSTINLGRILAPVYFLEDIPSQNALQDFVNKLRDESLLSQQIVSFSSKVQIHQVFENIAIEYPHLDGIYREFKWVLELGKSNKMTHFARRFLTL